MQGILCRLLVLSVTVIPSPQFNPMQAAEPPDSDNALYQLDSRFTRLAIGLDRINPIVHLNDGSLLELKGDPKYGTITRDDGKTWTSLGHVYDGPGPGRYTYGGLALQTRSGAIVIAYPDEENARWSWDKEREEASEASRDVWVARSLDGGRTWVDRHRAFEGCAGDLRQMIETSDGHLVLPITRWTHDPGRWTVCTYVSTDDGKTWNRSNIIDLGGHGDHDGVTEPTLVELKDHRLLMMMRTNWDRFWEAYSWDGGWSWREIRPSGIPASTSPGYMIRLSSGRLVFAWNPLAPGDNPRPLHRFKASPIAPIWKHASQHPADWYRHSLCLAFSDDEGQTWSEPIVFCRKRKGHGEALLYPIILEREPGMLWIIVRPLVLSVRESDLVDGDSNGKRR